MVTFAFCASIGVSIKFEINVVSATNTALRNIIVDLTHCIQNSESQLIRKKNVEKQWKMILSLVLKQGGAENFL